MAGKRPVPTSQHEFWRWAYARVRLGRFERSQKTRAAAAERKNDRRQERLDERLEQRVARSEKVNVLAMARIREIRRSPSPLGLKILGRIVRDKSFNADTRVAAATAVIAIETLGFQSKAPNIRRLRDPAAQLKKRRK